jgi:hypothetical protein
MNLMDMVSTKAPSLPSRVFLYAQEKWGKTSWACYAPRPIFIMTKGETGLLPLLESGAVRETAHFPDDAKDWDTFQDYVRRVRDDDHNFASLVIDTNNGAGSLLSAWVLQHEFNGQTGGRSGFNSFGAGEKACERHWDEFLETLDQIRLKRRMSIILLAHSRIRQASNPLGEDYDQIRPEGIEKLWTKTHKWADVIAAGAYQHIVKDDKVLQKSKRVLYTSDTPAAVAGNRYSLPAVIDCGNNAQTAFKNFATALAAAKKNGKPAEAKPTESPSPAAASRPVEETPPAAPSEEVPDTEDGKGEPAEPASKEQRAEMAHLIAALGMHFGDPATIHEINTAASAKLEHIGDLIALDCEQAEALIAHLKPQLEAKQERSRKRQENKSAKESAA